jgi:uncharacterized membrane protein
MTIDDLNAKEQNRLSAGKPVYRDADQDGVAGVHGYQLIDAPFAEVWATGTDFASTPRWIEHVADAEVHPVDGEHVDVTFHIRTPIGIRRNTIRVRSRENHNVEFWKVGGANDMKDVRGLVRARETEGGVVVDACVNADPAVWIPKVVVRIVIRQVLGEIIEGLRGEMKRRRLDNGK